MAPVRAKDNALSLLRISPTLKLIRVTVQSSRCLFSEDMGGPATPDSGYK